MIRGKTNSGFEFAIPDDVYDDYDLVMLFAEYEKNQSTLLIDAIADKFLGLEQKKALMDHLRDENGKLRTSAMIQALTEIEAEITKATNAPKNSEPSPT